MTRSTSALQPFETSPSSPVAGRSLRDLLAQGERPDRATLVDWGAQILDALAEAHARGILHRSLTEEAVVISPEGRVGVTGFGSTRLHLDPDAAPSPEQSAGEPATVQSDLYAVGSLLRRLSFAGALHRRRGLGERDPLVKVLARATFADPAARYRSAAEMADALREAGAAAVSAGPRRLGPSRTYDSNVREFPLPRTSARRPPVYSSTAPAPEPVRGRDEEERALWRALVLLVASLVLMTVVVTAGWYFLGHEGAAKKKNPGMNPGLNPTSPALQQNLQNYLSPPKTRLQKQTSKTSELQ